MIIVKKKSVNNLIFHHFKCPIIRLKQILVQNGPNFYLKKKNKNKTKLRGRNCTVFSGLKMETQETS